MSEQKTPQEYKPHMFHLSGIHEKLPHHEILSIVESTKEKYSVLMENSQCLIVNCSEKTAILAAQRAAYCHRVIKILYQKEFSVLTLENIIESLEQEVDISDYLSSPPFSYRVRVYHIGQKSKHIISMELEKKIGKIINTQTNNLNIVNLEKPDISFITIINDKHISFGIELYERENGFFKDRRPDLRPFFKPGTLEPRFARLMVNLTQISTGELLYDPFCGPGGILVEAAIIGCNVIGSDLSSKMLQGAKKNVSFYATDCYNEFILADCRDLPIRQGINAIATDPPYGRSTSTYGKEITSLLEHFFQQAFTLLKEKGTLVISMCSEIPLKEIGEAAGFELFILEKLYIHSSLTRDIGVFRKT